MKKGDWIVTTISLIVLEVIFLWCVDISVSAMINDGIVTNGFIVNDPMITYHIGLWGAVIAPVIMSFMLVHHILKEEKKEIIETKEN